MNIKDVITKAAKGETLTDEERALLAAFDADGKSDKTGDDDRVRNFELKNSRLQNEKKELADKLAEMESKLEELSTQGMSDQEKLAQTVEKLQANLQAKDVELSTIQASAKKADRQHQLDRIHGGVKWNRETISDTDSRTLTQSVLTDVDDLSDQSAVDAVLQPWLAERKTFVTAEIASGTGSHKSGAMTGATGSGVPSGGKLDMAKVSAMSDKEFLDPETNKAIWVAANQEAVASSTGTSTIEVL